MNRRLTAAEKGKGVAAAIAPPRAARVQIPDFDPSELVHNHDLILVGRITNPRSQKMWALLPFLADHWKVSTRPVGTDLGQGKFQYQFASEEDLLEVLANMPYHFAHWMIILQRWEPTLAASFPSEIPFWIQIQGVPSQLWSKVMHVKLAANIGIFENHEILVTAARMRVKINGLEPLITSSTLEFKNGDEVEAVLMYEKLEKHCSLCFMLNHEVKDCPDATEPQRKSSKEFNLPAPPSWTHSRSLSQRISDGNQGIPQPKGPRGFFGTTEGPSSNCPPAERRYHPRGSSKQAHSPFNTSSTTSGQSKGFAGRSTRIREPTPPRPVWRETRRRDLPRALLSSLDESGSSGGRKEIVVTSPRREDHHLPQEAIQVAMGEIRQVMDRYASCPDPTESAARKERSRLGEEEGQVVESAVHMVRAALEHSMRELTPPLPTRTPVHKRLGPVNVGDQEDLVNHDPEDLVSHDPEDLVSHDPEPVKKRLGRPPGKASGKALRTAGSSKLRRVTQASPRKRGPITNDKATIRKNSKRKLIIGPNCVSEGEIPEPRGLIDGQLPSKLKMKVQKDFQIPSSPLP
ncbi:hypothetical protein AALP_AAs59863U000100 [Arabis alpina]|uniref:DUF4283 domain-containing protein n=1 Tax=Arabis alpina TaxID=50452 RepID=A0A087G102_ARAAL|nr:hypothetical protein AALP_AAs59863U000100 [Arabis alpina]